MERVWNYSWRSIVALLGLLLVFLKAAQQVKWIGPDPALEFSLVMGAGLMVFLDNAYGVYLLYLKPKADKRRRKVEKHLLACLRTLGRDRALTFNLGASVYVYQRNWWRLDKKRLRRVRRYRLTDDPQESLISWSDAKGVVGKAAREGLPQHADWTALAPVWNANGGASVESYAALPEADRWGFSFEEFRQVASKYVEALAVPIMNRQGTKVLGVLGLDVPYRADSRKNSCILNTDDARRVASTCAIGLREVLDGE